MPGTTAKNALPELAPARLPAWSGRFKAAFPAMAFFGGFLWDAFTLGRSITSLDLFLLLGYLLGAAGLLVWLGRSAGSSPRVSPGPDAIASGPSPLEAASASPAKGPAWMRTLKEQAPDLALQFFFGGLFSALVIFYFLSSSHLPSLLLVLGLAALLSVNEFLGGHFRRFTLSWTLFATCAILFLNFALPHLFRSVHPVWFYVSTALGFGAVVLLKRASPMARGSLLPAAGVAAAMVGLYVAGAIPPVPLVKKQLLICRELQKQDGGYTGRIEVPPFWSPWRITERVVHRRPQEKVFCYTSVFVPPGIETELYHVWQHRLPGTGEWKSYSRIGFPIRGGRKDGYRGFTWKRNLPAGDWRVRVETEGGRVVGLHRFRVEAAPEGYNPAWKDLILP
jgi:hypothetical protein